ncbi:MAG: hypothetical protein WBQ14_02140 [Gaiellaceae bacterium]
MNTSPDRGETPRTDDDPKEDRAPNAAENGSEKPADDRYNGWTNRETWACHLWLTNTETLYRWAEETARIYGVDGLKEGLELLQETTIDSKDPFIYVEEAGLVIYARDARLALGDIGSLWRVDWGDVAEAFRES